VSNLADRILEDQTGRYAHPYTEAISDLFVAIVRANEPSKLDAFRKLQDITRETMGVAELYGAMSVLQATASLNRANYHRGDPSILFRDQVIVPRVTFSEAVEDFVRRAPVTLTNAAERTARRIAELYSERNVAAFVRAAEQSVTERAQKFIVDAIRAGVSENTAGRGLSMAVEQVRERSKAWSQAYSRMVFRTNANTATTAGRFKQGQDPDVSRVVPAMRYDAVGDSDTRPNHRAADGFMASNRSKSWSIMAPPQGYACRCQVSLVSRFELEDMGRIRPDGSVIDDPIPAGAGPDKGFRKGRPDIALG
jgi:SPP1 gp7 family putative phage head morphogenesis protein